MSFALLSLKEVYTFLCLPIQPRIQAGQALYRAGRILYPSRRERASTMIPILIRAGRIPLLEALIPRPGTHLYLLLPFRRIP
jgi:hypothetical protein